MTGWLVVLCIATACDAAGTTVHALVCTVGTSAQAFAFGVRVCHAARTCTHATAFVPEVLLIMHAL